MAKCVCVSVWLFAIVVTYSFLSTAFQHPGCCLSKLLFLTITEFFLPLLIIMVFTLRIMWALADRRLMQQSRYKPRFPHKYTVYSSEYHDISCLVLELKTYGVL